MDTGLKGKVVVVTGGANGIGRGIVECFVEEGSNVVIADWNEADADAAVRRLRDQGSQVAFAKMDVRQPSDIRGMVSWVMQTYGRIDVLVNDIGTHLYKPAIDMTVADFDKVVETDLRGHFLVSQQVFPHMIHHGGGAIVNIASVHALATRPKFSVYAAAKGGVVALTRGLALEGAPHHVRVNVVLPGMSMSKEFQLRLNSLTPEQREAALKRAAYNTPIGHVGEPKEIGYAAVFLASNKASFITGAALTVDGGETVHLDW